MRKSEVRLSVRLVFLDHFFETFLACIIVGYVWYPLQVDLDTF
jgi:hypothetical protein